VPAPDTNAHVTDTERFEAVFRAHHRAVLRYALRRADPATADEVVAETFLVCWRRLDDVPDDARPWLLGTARRCLANLRRSTTRSTALTARATQLQPMAEGRDPGDVLGAREMVRTAFAQLSETDREVLRLVAWDGLDIAAGARVLGCTRPAFAVRLHRARRRLAARLAAAEDAPPLPRTVLKEAT
jgi:RNA polymerase sigma-70 factor (ECF subfamily)